MTYQRTRSTDAPADVINQLYQDHCASRLSAYGVQISVNHLVKPLSKT